MAGQTVQEESRANLNTTNANNVLQTEAEHFPVQLLDKTTEIVGRKVL